MIGHGGSSAGLYLANTTSPIPSHCASIVATSTVRVNVETTINKTINLMSYLACVHNIFDIWYGNGCFCYVGGHYTQTVTFWRVVKHLQRGKGISVFERNAKQQAMVTTIL